MMSFRLPNAKHHQLIKTLLVVSLVDSYKAVYAYDLLISYKIGAKHALPNVLLRKTAICCIEKTTSHWLKESQWLTRLTSCDVVLWVKNGRHERSVEAPKKLSKSSS